MILPTVLNNACPVAENNSDCGDATLANQNTMLSLLAQLQTDVDIAKDNARAANLQTQNP